MHSPIATRSAALCLSLALAGCGDLPQPFRFHPGATAERLSQPPPARLAVPAPTDALLTADAATAFTAELARGLQGAEVAAMAQPSQKGDWVLVIRADQQPAGVVPHFTVLDPAGKDQGSVDGAPVPAAAWAGGDQAALSREAANAAPAIHDLLVSIDAQRMRADPKSLYNRPAKVVIRDVTGAPGDGNVQLTKQMKAELAKLGPLVQSQDAGADFVIQGSVVVVPVERGQVRVEITWSVTDASGADRGKIAQLNEVPPDTIAHYWGDIALVVAQQAAGGVRDVLATASGRRAAASAGPPS